MKLRPMLQVHGVATSSAWYQQVLGLTSGHGGDDYEMLFDDGEFVLQLHRLDADEHPALQANIEGATGAGISLWFEAADTAAFEALVAQAHSVGATVAEEPHWNPVAHHHEAALVDPDGYVVMLCSPFEFSG